MIDKMNPLLACPTTWI